MSNTVFSNEIQSTVKKKTKLSQWVSSSFETDLTLQNGIYESRKRKVLQPSSQTSQKITEQNKQNDETWVQKYSPRTIEELAVHKKKVLEVESWITQSKAATKGGAPILLISGPPGSGKSATVMVVARKHDIYVEEWTNPLTTSFAVSRQAGLYYQTEVDRFEEFLFRSGKYNSVVVGFETNSNLNSAPHRKIVLLEELPNFLYRDPSKIVELLTKYRRTQRWPLVLILSDGRTSDPLRRQLRAMSNPLFTITFNPISTSIMTKALTRICAVEHRSVSKNDVTDASLTGDIRAAINCLQFSSQSDTILQATKKRKKAVNSTSSCLAAKDTNMILFRALGKIFYCKRDKDNRERSSSVGKTYRDPLVVQPETILEQCCLSGNSFSLFLHHNYLTFFDHNSIDDITAASDYLSSADQLSSALTSSDLSSGVAESIDRYEGILAARGLVYSNSLRATSELCSSSSGSWRPLHKPSWFEVRRQEQENRVTAHQLFWKQKDDLPMLAPLAAKFDPPKRNFIREVVAIPKWRSFRSCNDRLSEQDTGNDEPETENTPTTGDVTVKVETEEDDDDVTIEDFSD